MRAGPQLRIDPADISTEVALSGKEWECTVCTLMNGSHLTHCDACGSLKDAQAPMVQAKRLNTFFKPKTNISALSAESEQRYLCGLIDEDQKELLLSVFGFSVEMFKVVMATLLSIFVPQRCPPTDEDPQYHTCTENENVTHLTTFNEFVLAWNFVTLAFCLIHYVLVFLRERSFIRNLDVNPQKGINHLPTIIEKYPRVKAKMYTWNVTVLVSSITTLVFIVINVIVSGVLVIRDYYDGFRTVTVYCTNSLLLATVMQKTLVHAWVGLQKTLALSCINFEPISYNVIDHDLLRKLHTESKKAQKNDKATI